MYALKWHRTLTADKWRNFGITRQILMIANELNRAEHCIEKNDTTEGINALERAFELIDLTVDTVSRKNIIRELIRFRELLAGQYIKKEKSPKEINALQKALVSLNGEAYRLLADSFG
jgi:hypothetical protein